MFPRWLSLMFLFVLGYMLYTSSQVAHAPQQVATAVTIPAIPEETALAQLTDIERWKRKLNPDYAATMNCSVDAPTRGKLAFKVIEEVAGNGAGAACGDSIHLQLTIWKADGSKAFDAPVTLALGKRELASGLDAGLQSLAVGGIRTLLLPPSALARSATSKAPATALAALPASTLAVVTVKRVK